MIAQFCGTYRALVEEELGERPADSSIDGALA
jgi:hypothetical protein